MHNVPFFDYPFVFTSEEEAFVSIFQDVGRRGAFILQSDLKEFERELAACAGVKHAVGMSNATDALHLAMRCAGIGAGDEVIFCAHTMVATPASVYFAGATPVPVDCGPDHLIDPDAIRSAITPRTKAILPTQLNGRLADMDALTDIAREHGLVLLEDAAQALGARYRGRPAGSFGRAAAVSFYPAKTLGCLGDGGCILTDDDEIYEKVMAMRDHGRDGTGEVVMWGLNSKLDNLQAALLRHQLRLYDRAITRRREIAAVYDARLRECPGLKLPPAPNSDPQHFDIYQNYEIEAEYRNALKTSLAERGVGTLIQWGGKAVHHFPKLGFHQKLDYTNRLFERLLMLPMNVSLSNDDVHYVCDCVADFYQIVNRKRSVA